MRRGILITISAVIAAALYFIPGAEARKTGYKHSSRITDGEKEEEMVTGSFMVASQCEECNNGYRLDQVVFSGFDKKKNSSKESFFITNNTDRTLTSVTLYIEYKTLDGRQLHKKYSKLNCHIPAGETRKADLPSWDTQHSFYYYKSEGSPKGGNPFEVVFDPVAYYLSF